MSEGVQASPGASRAGSRIRNPRDFYGGLVLVALGLFALWAARDLPGMHGFAFGPGTAPRLFAWILIGLGGAVAVLGLLTEGPAMEQFSVSGPLAGAALVVVYGVTAILVARMFPAVARLQMETLVASAVVGLLALAMARVAPRGPVFITLAVLIFAGCIRTAGLVVTSYLTILSAAAATTEVRWVETLIWAAVLTAFCVLLFPIALNLPFQLWPLNMTFSAMLGLN